MTDTRSAQELYTSVKAAAPALSSPTHSKMADVKSNRIAATSDRQLPRTVAATDPGEPTNSSRAGPTHAIPSMFASIGPSKTAGASPRAFRRSTSNGCSAPVAA